MSYGESSSAGHVVGGTDHPCEAVAGVVEEELDLVGSGSCAGDGVHLALSGGDEVLVFNGGESLAFFNIKVDVRDKELGVHVRRNKGRSGGGVNGDLAFSKGPEVTVRGIGVLVDNGAALCKGTESHLDLDLVVGQGDEGDRKTVFHEVLVEPERQRHVKLAGLACELDHVLLNVSRVSELTDLLTKAGTRALGHLFPEKHPLGVKSVHFSTTDLDLNLLEHGETDSVDPVAGFVCGVNSVSRSVKHGGRCLDGGERHFKKNVRHKVTVTAHVGRHLLPKTNSPGAEVVLFEIFSKASVTLVHSLEQSHVGVSIEVTVLLPDRCDLNIFDTLFSTVLLGKNENRVQVLPASQFSIIANTQGPARHESYLG